MAYSTPESLRDRYRQGPDSDEFSALDDSDLEQALEAASAEIDSYRPQGTLSGAATVVLADKAKTLARMLIYQHQEIEETHPVVRDGLAVRRWLELLAQGVVRLPRESDESWGKDAFAPTRSLVYDDTWHGEYTIP